MSTNARGVRRGWRTMSRLLQRRADGICDCDFRRARKLAPGTLFRTAPRLFAGRSDIGPVGSDWVVEGADVAWIPETGQGPRPPRLPGPLSILKTVRLMHRPAQ